MKQQINIFGSGHAISLTIWRPFLLHRLSFFRDGCADSSPAQLHVSRLLNCGPRSSLLNPLGARTYFRYNMYLILIQRVYLQCPNLALKELILEMGCFLNFHTSASSWIPLTRLQ